MILFSRLVMLIIVIVLLVFCMSNLEPVTVNMVGWESPQMPLFLILMFVFFFGFFLALFWQALRSVSMKREFKPAPVVPPAEKPEKEKKNRKWGLKKGKKRDADSGRAQQEETSEDQASQGGKEKSSHADEPVDMPAIEDDK